MTTLIALMLAASAAASEPEPEPVRTVEREVQIFESPTSTTNVTTKTVTKVPRRKGTALLIGGLATAAVTVPVGMTIAATPCQRSCMGPPIIGTIVGGSGVVVGTTLGLLGAIQLVVTRGNTPRREPSVAIGPAGVSGRF